MVPHKGIRAGPLRMFIARKPHSTGIKLYCLADATREEDEEEESEEEEESDGEEDEDMEDDEA